MKHKLTFALLFIFFQFHQVLAQGCSQCKLLTQQGVEADEASFGTNINYGIIYLMVIPYLMLMFLFRKQIIRFLKSVFAISK